MKPAGANQLLADVHGRDLCIGCGACVDLCPYFKNYKGLTSQLFPCTLEQGRCHAYCPKAEVDLNFLSREQFGFPYDGSPLGHSRDVLAARAGGKAPKVLFQAGGTVTALLTFAMQGGTIDAAAVTDQKNMIPVSKAVTRWEDIAGFATSKFMAAPTLSAVNRAAQQGHAQIGLVGTPCQVTAGIQMRFNRLPGSEDRVPIALIIGLFCNWSLGTRGLLKLIAEKMDPADITGMDLPPPPADRMQLHTANRIEDIPLSDIRPLIPSSCFVCLDLTAELADLSVGMFESRPGWNTLIVRSEKGAKLVNAAREAGFLEAETYPTNDLDHLTAAAATKKARSMRMLVQRDLINTADDQPAVLRMPPEAMAAIKKYSGLREET